MLQLCKSIHKKQMLAIILACSCKISCLPGLTCERKAQHLVGGWQDGRAWCVWRASPLNVPPLLTNAVCQAWTKRYTNTEDSFGDLLVLMLLGQYLGVTAVLEMTSLHFMEVNDQNGTLLLDFVHRAVLLGCGLYLSVKRKSSQNGDSDLPVT